MCISSKFVNSREREFDANQISGYVRSLQTNKIGEFCMCPGGNVTLYSSCFATMLLHYLGELTQLSKDTRRQWANYILQWQNPNDGYFIGPELVRKEITSERHNWDVVRMHLAVHVLPALDLLGVQPLYPLTFAHRFLDLDYLKAWLEARNWQKAWLEGNNLLFVGQFLVHLRDVEYHSEAQKAIDLYLGWLDRYIDPATGLWGTSDGSSCALAMYGAYHQLLVYFYEKHPVPYPKELVTSTLNVQEFDGGFSATGKGGACEDVDAVSILVNLYQMHNFKRPEIRRALRKTFKSVLKRMTPEGGFVYRWDSPFSHMSIPRTRVPSNTPHLFATWFGVHTLALLAEILTDEPLLERKWYFNRVLSMGWHSTWSPDQHMLTEIERKNENKITYLWSDLRQFVRVIGRKLISIKKTVLKLSKNAINLMLKPIDQPQ